MIKILLTKWNKNQGQSHTDALKSLEILTNYL